MNVLKTFLPRSLPSSFGALDCVVFPGGGGLLYITMRGITSIQWSPKNDKEPLVKTFMTEQSIYAIDIDPEAKCFASLSADNTILIWNFQKRFPIMGHNAHCSLHNKKSSNIAVHISFMKNGNLLSLCDQKIVIYCIKRNLTSVQSSFVNLSGQITTLKCSPYDEQIFACGSNKGVVLLCNLKKSTVICTFGCHYKPVLSLSWNAVEFETYMKNLETLTSDNVGKGKEKEFKIVNDFPESVIDINRNEEHKKFDILLASVSFDGQIFLWNTTTGDCSDRFKIDKGNCSNNCKILWKNPTELFILITNGDLIELKLNEKRFQNSDVLRQYKLEMSSNFKVENVFTFAIQQNEDDLLWLIKGNANLSLSCMDLKNCEEILCHDMVLSPVYAICEYPNGNSKITLAFSDSSLALLDLQKVSQTRTNFQYKKIRLFDRIKTLTWHPNGKLLAYGTLAGTVSVINTTLRTQTTFNSQSEHMICAMAWRGDHIFVLKNDQVKVFAIEFHDALTVKGFIGNYSMIAIYKTFILLGSNHGCLKIFREIPNENSGPRCLSFEQIQRLNVAGHLITDIIFNPFKTEQFAMAASEAYVYLFNLNARNGIAEMKQKLYGGSSKAQIYKVKWSNRDSNKLVTCGLDGGLRIFDLNRPENEQLIYVKEFHCPLYSAMFLPIDERYIFVTGKLITIEIVDTAQQIMENNDIKLSRSLYSIKWAEQSNKQYEIMENPFTDIKTETIKESIGEKLRGEFSKLEMIKKQETELLESLTLKENKCPLLKIQEFLTLTKNSEKSSTVELKNLFGEKLDAVKMIQNELANLKSSTNSFELNSIFLSHVTGDFETLIQNAIKAQNLNDFHVSIASSVSLRFWEKCCQAFAQQLSDQGHALKAALYFLIINQNLNAIRVLMAGNYFKEAMLVGRFYLDKNDPVLQFITDKWINSLEIKGDLKNAALICTISRQYHRAYKILSQENSCTSDKLKAMKLLKEMN